MNSRRVLLPMAAGVFFAALQFGYFLALERGLSSAWTTYAAVGAGWLLGVLAGLWVSGHRSGPGLEPRLRACSVAGFYLLWALASLHPFSAILLPTGLAASLVSGAHAGLLFRKWVSERARAGPFLFHENNGFLLGMAASLAGFYWNARVSPALLPGAACLTLWLGRGPSPDR